MHEILSGENQCPMQSHEKEESAWRVHFFFDHALKVTSRPRIGAMPCQTAASSRHPQERLVNSLLALVSWGACTPICLTCIYNFFSYVGNLSYIQESGQLCLGNNLCTSAHQLNGATCPRIWAVLPWAIVRCLHFASFVMDWLQLIRGPHVESRNAMNIKT